MVFYKYNPDHEAARPSEVILESSFRAHDNMVIELQLNKQSILLKEVGFCSSPSLTPPRTTR